MTDDLDERIDELAIEVEQAIAENKKRLEQLPEFTPRSSRSKKLRRVRDT